MARAPVAGYSATPLIAKLGYKAGQRALLVAVPATLRPVLEGPEFAWRRTIGGAAEAPADSAPLDVAHLFVDRRAVLEDALPRLRALLAPAGMVWVSWPKKAAKVPTDITEDVIRALALTMDLVDVKVCAVDPVWSGLKLVIPVAKRPAG
ncbi:MAG: DUF3052 domain-containing protein [Inquilinus sp.]|nr:DUF3052 domain-containing protein [Inquilinus sp.]